MAEGKNSFVLYKDLKHTVDKLPDETAGQLFKYILDYVNDLNPETDDIIISIAFEPIKQNLKRDLKKWESIRERNKLNGSKGGRPREPKKPTGLSGNPNKPKKPVTVNDTVNVNVTVIKREERQLKFKQEIDLFKDEYSNQMLEAFFNYWSEPNKSKTKMRFELEKTWEIKRRLVNWANRQPKQTETKDSINSVWKKK